MIENKEVPEEVEEEKVTKKREHHRHANTLEKDVANLDLKKLDTEVIVDPLFRKTSADFDEGGARGLLLNHLSLGLNGQIIFDASDVLMNQGEDMEEESMHLVDMSKLKGSHGTECR